VLQNVLQIYAICMYKGSSVGLCQARLPHITALCRDPATRYLNGYKPLWTGKIWVDGWWTGKKIMNKKGLPKPYILLVITFKWNMKQLYIATFHTNGTFHYNMSGCIVRAIMWH